ncbi:MAG TPA: hypothetical protein VK181_05090 [Rhizobium sp.]|nr:hypothetical protein [Rhizobium sp.]
MVYEILEMSPELKPLIDTQASEQDMKRHIMTSLMTASLGQIVRIRDLDQQVHLQSTADTIADLIANDIRGALNVPLVGPQTIEGLAFTGPGFAASWDSAPSQRRCRVRPDSPWPARS